MTNLLLPRELDVVVIGGGQAALALGYYLKQTGLSFALLDNQVLPGGAWTRTWRSLQLFSPASWSSLPGWPMPPTREAYPRRAEVVAYLGEYEHQIDLPVVRPIQVEQVSRNGRGFLVRTAQESVRARAVISATGTWASPVLPDVPGAADFHGRLVHSAQYAGATLFTGRRVLVVGGGNSGAQIFAELDRCADASWVTGVPPHFLPDDVDGRTLFEHAEAQYRLLSRERTPQEDPFGDIVMVPEVRAARERGALNARPMFSRFTTHGVVWADGTEEDVDAVIFATGFRPNLRHLAPLQVLESDGLVRVKGTRSEREPMLWLVGYGQWTGFASATIHGVAKSAEATINEVVTALAPPQPS